MDSLGLGHVPLEMTLAFEQLSGLSFKPGRNPDARFMAHLWEDVKYRRGKNSLSLSPRTSRNGQCIGTPDWYLSLTLLLSGQLAIASDSVNIWRYIICNHI